MNIEIKKYMLSPSKYALKSPYEMTPKYIVVHNTGNNASAKNEISYMINNNSSTSYHYAVDDFDIIQAIPDNRNAFHAGDGSGKGNRQGIGIEICYSTGSEEKFLKAEKNAVKLIVHLMRKYNIPISNVIRHYDCSGKICPHKTMQLGWNRFLKMVEDEFNGSSTNSSSNSNANGLKLNVNGKSIVVDRILKDNQNYIKLADLRALGWNISLDNITKTIIVKTT